MAHMNDQTFASDFLPENRERVERLDTMKLAEARLLTAVAAATSNAPQDVRTHLIEALMGADLMLHPCDRSMIFAERWPE